MNKVWHRQQTPQYTSEAWRNDEYSPSTEEDAFMRLYRSHSSPDVLDQSRLLDLLGRINYKILSGNRVYVEAGGVVYKALYGAYWRSVFTGIEHYSLRCEEVSGSKWLKIAIVRRWSIYPSFIRTTVGPPKVIPSGSC